MSKIDRFQESIDEYFENRPRLEYLDLETGKNRKLLIEGKRELYCYQAGDFGHKYHSDNIQQNLICDLNLVALDNIHTSYDRLVLLSKVCLKNHHILLEKFKNLEKLVVSKTCNCDNLGRRLGKLPTRDEVTELINSIFEQPKKIETEAIRLTKELDNRIQKVEDLVEKLSKHLV